MPRGFLKRRALAIAALVTLALGGAAVFWHQRPVPVNVAQAWQGEAIELVYATGFVESDQPAALSARLTAPVIAVHAEEGDRVRKGQPLIVLDGGEQQGLLAQAEAERLGAELAERRTVTLYEQGWVTRAARDQAVATASAARAGQRAAHARAANTVIRAPFTGIVLKRDVEPGDLAVPGAVLMQIGDPAQVRITTTVDERDIIGVRPGQTALLSTDSLRGRVIKGVVRAITPGGDPTQRAFRVRLGLEQPVDLPFGLTLEANIVTRRHADALLIPASAYADGRAWTLDEAGRAQRKPVQVGIVGEDAVEIVRGLDLGDQVIVSPPDGLADGARVRIVQ